MLPSAALFATFHGRAVRVTLPYIPPNFEDLRRGLWVEEPQPALQAYLTEFERSCPPFDCSKPEEALHAYAYTTNFCRLHQWLDIPGKDHYWGGERKYARSRTASTTRTVPVPPYSIQGGWGNFSFAHARSWDLPPNTVLLGWQAGGWRNAISRLVTLATQ